MFSADKPLPPPPAPPKSRNESLAASMSSYRTRPTPSSKSSTINFNTARAIFDIAKQPEVQRTVTSAAKNPAVRAAAVSVAKNERARAAVVKTAQDENARNTILNIARLYDPQSTKNSSSSYEYGPSQTKLSDIHANPFASQPSQTPRALPTPKSAPLYPSLLDEKPSLKTNESSWISPPQPSRQPHPSTSLTSSDPPMNRSWDSLVSNNFSSIHNELASLNLFHSSSKRLSGISEKVPPARPPPPKKKSSTAPASPTNEPHAVVKYPYKATQFDELTCQPNDVVILKKEVDEQWIYALNTRTGEHGIVPIVFLDIKVPLVPTQTRETTARAVYDYDTGVDGDLKFRANDIIKVVEKVNDEWLRGEIGSTQGIFPVNFVQLLGPLPSPSQSQQSPQKLSSQKFLAPMSPKISTAKETVTAAYDYNSGVADDLVFRQGDVIEVVERVGPEWIKGRLNGAVGLVPCTYVVDSSANKKTNSTIGAEKCPRIVHAVQDYFNASSEHLCFSKGDEIEVIEEVDSQWLKGKLQLNMPNMKSFPCGIFPRSAVQ
ncbi:unnamed protein product [Toxocara canis]|uniref:SH3 domain-containing kinase-binding protein 1 n=1 Tax=Toxocara canis TaxID=6265 RepID=A0A183UR41_TOXCA|nr:unnamed protein product [Toxocara canis]